MSLTLGTKLGPYEILGLLGTGGMGEVYRAKDTRLGREVAVKVLPASFSQDADRLRRFEQEARAVAALNHPNILAIHDIGAQEGTPFLVSELLEGTSLRAELDSGVLSARKATNYSVQIAQGLAAAHEKNIVHRDLKPENVFITKEGRVKILDFGLAKLASKTSEVSIGTTVATLTSLPTAAGVVMGTVGYMAPEQVRGAAVDSRTDIFAFGAVLYEMVAGRRAFQRDTAAETMTAILKEDPPELSETAQLVSPGLERIVRRCLEKQPEQRFQSARDLAFALDALSGTTSSKSIPASPSEREGNSRRRIGFAAAAALLLAAMLGAAWHWRPAPYSPPTFRRVSYHQGQVILARFEPDGKTVAYSAILNGGTPDTYTVREDYPESASAGLHGALLLAISKQGQMAVLTHPQYHAHYAWKGTLATTPLGGSAPRELLENVSSADWSPDGSEMAVILSEKDRWRLEYPIGKILLEGDNWISDARISPDGKHVALFRHPPNVDDRGDVLLLDRTGQMKALSSGWESLEGLAWSPSGDELYFAAAESGEQWCIRSATVSAKVRTVYCGTIPTRIQDFSATGRALVATDELQVSMAFIEHGAKEERDLSWLDSVYNPRLSADGGKVLFTDQSGQAGNEYGVYVRDSDGSPAVRIAGGGFGVDISPDGKWAMVFLPGDPERRVQVVPVGTGQPRVYRWDGFQPLWGLWFPDSHHMLIEGRQDNSPRNAYVTDIEGSPPKLVGTGVYGWTSISPDGNSLLYQHQEVWTELSVPDQKLKAVPGLSPKEVPIRWTSDPGKVFTQIATPTGFNLFKLDLITGKSELWQSLNPKNQIGLRQSHRPISITPDGRWIVYDYGTDVGQLYSSETMK